MEQSNNTALLIMDIQAGIVGRLADPKPLLGNAAKAIAHARSKNIPVIYVVVSFRQGAPEISMNNKGFSNFKETLSKADMNEYTKVHADVAPRPGEITVTKRRISAFTGSDLEVVLRAYGIQHMVLCGISTSGVVLSTLREAADKDYRLTVLNDCCADADEEVHRVLTTKVFPRQAEVLSVADWTKE
jgi:nicotinamidase-related amidase